MKAAKMMIAKIDEIKIRLYCKITGRRYIPINDSFYFEGGMRV